MADKSPISRGRPSFRRQNQQAAYLPNLQDASAATAHLRRALNVMFPPAYIRLFHQPPQSVCTLFSLKLSSQSALATSLSSGSCDDTKQSQTLEDDDDYKLQFEASSEPSSRAHVLQLRDSLQESLVEHQAKPVGLCPIRRAIYDQCFDELIRQVTVGCIEQGLLLFRIRNELRMTINCYRRAYESAVRYGLNKALDASLRLAQIECLEPAEDLSKVSSPESHEKTDKEASETSRDSRLISLEAKLREYYESELAKKDEIIAQQRAILKEFNQRR